MCVCVCVCVCVCLSRSLSLTLIYLFIYLNLKLEDSNCRKPVLDTLLVWPASWGVPGKMAVQLKVLLCGALRGSCAAMIYGG